MGWGWGWTRRRIGLNRHCSEGEAALAAPTEMHVQPPQRWRDLQTSAASSTPSGESLETKCMGG